MRAHIARLTIFAVSTASVLAIAPPAHATEADSQFLAVVTELGLVFGSQEEATAAGNNVCDVVAEGTANNVDPARIRRDIIDSLLGEGVTGEQATRLMVAAIGAYCPVYDGVLTG
ncbi:DUF732 domain-containing protein [Mycolicibacterium iranicum]|uniref:DUF732 domain-containing protein n=1 Tax=Mycolicibacterium iranicum TaxID=912594 RepID=A0A178LZA2_MYCIR|nr:DUF732 domain-containing protein [Mycolicibacterium iranicum]OAN40284.1 hypothetical protein A4X20_14235 [Mycolicibacterium iranicum]